jgi:hypothetical protein
MHRAHAAVAVAVLVALAGCPVGGSGSAQDPASFEYPDGFSADGITNGTTAVQTHAGSLEEPYSVNFSLQQVSSRGRATVEGSIESRPGEERSLTRVTQRAGSDFTRVQMFRTGSQEYVYRTDGQGFSHDLRRQPFRPPVYADRSTLAEMLGNLDLNASAVRTNDSTEIVVYDVTNVSAERLSTTVTATNGTVTVDEFGTIRTVDVRFTQVITGVERDVTFRYTTHLGANVTIERPSWTDEARG